jgi:hypothetical protein
MWSIREGAAGGTVSSGGLYTAPSGAGTYHVVATSVADSRASGSSTITVTAPPPPPPAIAVSVNPSSATVAAGGTTSFTATVANATNQAVTWSVQEGAAGGTVSGAGVYTAPSAAGTYHVRATSQADSTKSAAVTVTVTVPPVTVSLNPTTASVTAGGSVTFVATVRNSSNLAVTWSVQEGAAGGTVSGAGVYTAPSSPGTYHVVARSQADTTKTATATVTVTASTPPPMAGGLFTAPNSWNTPVNDAPVSARSGSILAALDAAGGWGFGRMQIDFSIKVLHADASTPVLAVAPASGCYTPDCDTNMSVPLPAGGALEGEAGYACTGGGDCHLLVVDGPRKKLYELYQGNLSGGILRALCGVTWDLTRSYPPELRGDQCTSTDAAGLPVAALLFTADEVAAGSIDHAVRFILPNARMARGVFVRPATHAGAPSGASTLPPYGSRLRLKASYPVATLPSEGARVVARALQKYGMVLADGGNVALTAADDAFTQHKWAEVGVNALSLQALKVTDFEVVDTGPTIPLTYDCVRNGL